MGNINLYIDTYIIAYHCPFIERDQSCPLLEIDAQIQKNIDKILRNHLLRSNRRERLQIEHTGSIDILN